MKILFIADLHLNKSYLDSYNLFVKFLNNLTSEIEAVYILGDLFEFWIDDKFNDEFVSNVKQLLKKTTQKFPIYIIKGNRDFLLGNKFTTETGTIILPDLFTLNLYGNKVLLMHGDFLCTKDLSHIYFTKIIRNRISILILNILPIWLKLKLAQILRKFSIKKRANNLNATYKSNAESSICPNKLEKLMHQYGVKILIHGHTHVPNIYNFSSKHTVSSEQLTRIVLGDWHTKAKFLEFTPTGYELKEISI